MTEDRAIWLFPSGVRLTCALIHYDVGGAVTRLHQHARSRRAAGPHDPAIDTAARVRSDGHDAQRAPSAPAHVLLLRPAMARQGARLRMRRQILPGERLREYGLRNTERGLWLLPGRGCHVDKASLRQPLPLQCQPPRHRPGP